MMKSILTGYLIGMITSIPVGPIAILIIQRTLQKGRWTGFASGLGAATSDSLYALLALLGLAAVMDFINTHTILIQVLGSVMIMMFGLYIFLKNPSSDLQRERPSNNYIQSYLSAFLLTVANPFIIFLFIGVFAKFEFLSPNAPTHELFIGMASVFAGSASWWFLLTLVGSIFHGKFNIRGLWILNKTTGGLLMLVALVLLIKMLLEISNVPINIPI